VLTTQYPLVKNEQSASETQRGLEQSELPKDSVGQTQRGAPLLATQILFEGHLVVSQVGGVFKVQPVMVLGPLEEGDSPVAM